MNWLVVNNRFTDYNRVLVCGGRNYQQPDIVFYAMDRLTAINGEILVIHGACCEYRRPTELRGADRWVQEWAQMREMPYLGVPARWVTSNLGRSAGQERNQRMLNVFQPTSVVAFTGGAGTKHMCDIAHRAGLVIWKPDEDIHAVVRTRRPTSGF